MTPDEIMIHALQNANGGDPVELAERMKAFLDRAAAGLPVQPVPAKAQPVLDLSEPKDTPASVEAKDITLKRYNRVWTDSEVEKLAFMLKDGKTPLQIAEALGRGITGVLSAINKLKNGHHIGRRKSP